MMRVPWKTSAVEEVEVDVEELVAELLSNVVAVPDGPTTTLVVDVIVIVLSEIDVSVTVLGLELPAKYSPYPEIAMIKRTSIAATSLLEGTPVLLLSVVFTERNPSAF
jgi:hypothetical protein